MNTTDQRQPAEIDRQEPPAGSMAAVAHVAAGWQRLSAEDPPLAALGERLLGSTSFAYLGTVANDGRPRIHPICPVLRDGHLMGAILSDSAKCADLRRDGRYTLHSLIGATNREFWVQGTARPLADHPHPDVDKPWLECRPGSEPWEFVVERAGGTIYDADEEGNPIPSHRRWTLR